MALTRAKAAEPELLDAEALADLRALFGERAGALLALSRQVLGDRVAAVARAAEAAGASRAAAAEARRSLGLLAHEIRGVAGQIGLTALAGEAAELERRCERPGGASPAGVPEFLALARRSLAALPDR